MAGHISCHVFPSIVLMDKAIQDFNEVLWIFEIILNSDIVGDSGSTVLQDTIQMGKAVLSKLGVGLDVLDDFEETSNHSLSFLLLLYPYIIKYIISFYL